MWGIYICLLLLTVYTYLFRYLIPVIQPEGQLSDTLVKFPLITGHAFLPLAVYAFDSSPMYVQYAAGIGYIIFLCVIYFGIGAGISIVKEKIRKKVLNTTLRKTP